MLLLTLPGHIQAASLHATVVQGSSAFDPPELFDVYRSFLGETVTEQTAKAIADALQEKYISEGYLRPGYAIADTGTVTGIVRIRLVEPVIMQVRVDGNAGPHREKLESLVDHLDPGQSLRADEVRDALRRARGLPGLVVNVAAEPADGRSGSYVLAIDSEYRPLEGSVTLSNRGTQEIGRNLLTARLQSNSLLGPENTTGLFITTAENSSDYRGGGLFSSSSIGSRGASLQLQGAVTSLQSQVQDIVLQQRRERFLIEFAQPLRSWSDRDLSLSSSFEVENLDVIQDALATREDRLRSLRAGMTQLGRSGSGQSLLGFDVEQGLSAFGSRLDNFVVPDDGRRKDFSIVRLRYVQLRQLNEAWLLRWDLLAQHSPHVLPSIKRFRVGGGRIGRGFEAAAASGDRGVGNKLELRRRFAAQPAWLERADTYAYYDLGTTWRNDVSDRESASSAGIGMALRSSQFSGYLEIAQPLTHADADGSEDAGLFAEIVYRF